MGKFMTAVSIAALTFGFSGGVAAETATTPKPVIDTAPAAYQVAQQTYRESGGQPDVGGEADAAVEAGKSAGANRGVAKPSADIEGEKQVGENPDTKLGDGGENYRESGGRPDVGGADAEVK